MSKKKRSKDDDYQDIETKDKVPIKGLPGRSSFKVIPKEKKEFITDEANRLR